ncbi:MAG: ATP-binding cassette subfamily B multidrug efflux pump [Flavobacteriales bacterium]|jgi:ATP-binding cassette subfamily B multidrug efflux pump
MYNFFESLLNPFPKEKIGTPPSTLFGFCRFYAKGSERLLILIAIVSAITAVLEILLFSFVGTIVDWLNQFEPQMFFQENKTQLILMSIVALVLLPLAAFLRATLMHQGILSNFPMSVRWQAHGYLLRQSMEFYQDEFAGRLANKVMQTALAVRESITKTMDVMVYVAVTFVSSIALTLTLDWRLSLPFLAWLAVYCTTLRYFLPRLRDISQKQADARSLMTGRIVDTYTNIATVKLFSHTQRESSYARESMEEFLATTYPQMRLATSLTSIIWIVNCTLIFSVALLSILLWTQSWPFGSTQSTISSGSIAVAIALTLKVNGVSQWVMWEVSSLFESLGTVRDGINTLTMPNKLSDNPDAKGLRIDTGEIEFKNIQFDYGSKNIFEYFSLTVKPGEKIGLVGRSGAGKSTLVNLLLRIYDTQAGEISIDGQNIKSVTQDTLRQNIGIVSQDTSLLHRSIRENIVYGRPDATEEEIHQAVVQASAHEFISDLKDNKGRIGLDAHVGERGVKLSGGQRQRIAIARALLKNSPILLLDEATSALDSEVESAIQQNLEKLMNNKTVIAIAHRLSTIAALDRLIVIDDGKIIEQGSHDELLSMNGVYANLWQHQSGGFLPQN